MTANLASRIEAAPGPDRPANNEMVRGYLDGCDLSAPEPMPRTRTGRFLTRRCPDLNCGGQLTRERDGYWHCDGLTHATLTSPLLACEYTIAPHVLQREPVTPALAIYAAALKARLM